MISDSIDKIVNAGNDKVDKVLYKYKNNQQQTPGILKSSNQFESQFNDLMQTS